MSEPEEKKTPAASLNAKPLPDDFHQRIATKLVLIVERERDSEIVLQKLASTILRNLHQEGRIPLFYRAMEFMLKDPESHRYASLSYTSLVVDLEHSAEQADFLNHVINLAVDDHIYIRQPEHQLDYNRKKFSGVARHLGEVFISMIDLNSDLYEIISTIFSMIIRQEMVLEQADKEVKDSSRRISTSKSEEEAKAAKKLFDEIVDYIHARGEFRSESLNQQNPNEFMSVLADRMRGTRRYVMQDIQNRQALLKKKEVEKELSERLAGAEEIILAKDSFKKALHLFWTEKLYNFKYLSVEKVRVTLQVAGIMIGIVYFLAGYLNVYGLKWWEGLIILGGMYIASRFLCSRRAFNRFFPNDVSKELEVVVGSFTPTLRRMSKDQTDAFMIRQVRDSGNIELLPLLPEFVKYVYAVMPERKSAIIALEELAEIMENLELDIARAIRSISHHRAA